jgi:predicted RNase H-like nuclease
VVQLGRARPESIVVSTFTDLIARVPMHSVIGIDIPIGLQQAGPRACEKEARMRLRKPRSNSVFSAPLRACLTAATYEEACNRRYKIERKKMSRQAFGIVSKVSEVDKLLTTNRELARRVIEVHPEVSFAEWNGGNALRFSKHKADGKAERRELIESAWPGMIDSLRPNLRGQGCALDDLYDAFAALWSMRRHAKRQSLVLGDGAKDSRGLPMRIVA